MAKRATTGRKTAGTKKTSPEQQTQSYGEAVGQTMKDVEERPGMAPQTSDPAEMAREMSTITHEMIANRAYEIWKSQGGSDMDNWLRAERELRGSQIAAL